MKKIRASRGFTLVEIMIVVAIIGLLAGLALPNFARARSEARVSACVNNLRLIQSAKDQYAIQNNQLDSVVPAAADISPYLKAPQLVNGLPREPVGGAYSINEISVAPTCDQGGAHVL